MCKVYPQAHTSSPKVTLCRIPFFDKKVSTGVPCSPGTSWLGFANTHRRCTLPGHSSPPNSNSNKKLRSQTHVRKLSRFAFYLLMKLVGMRTIHRHLRSAFVVLCFCSGTTRLVIVRSSYKKKWFSRSTLLKLWMRNGILLFESGLNVWILNQILVSLISFYGHTVCIPYTLYIVIRRDCIAYNV